MLDSIDKYAQIRVLSQHEQLIRQALIRRVEAVLPQNIGVDLNQIASLNVSYVLDMQLRLTQESEYIQDYVNVLGLMINKAEVFPERGRE